MTLLWLSGAFVVGAWLGVQPNGGWSPPGVVLLLWAVAIVLVVLRERVLNRWLLPALVGLLLIFGLARVSTSDGAVPPDDLPPGLRAGSVEFEAVLETEPRPYGSVSRLPLLVRNFFSIRYSSPWVR